MNTELQALFEQDQADRNVMFEQLDYEQRQQITQRDRDRRQRVKELIGSQTLQAPEDYFHAAFMQLFLQLGNAYYVVGGQVALNELLQVATSIPWKQ